MQDDFADLIPRFDTRGWIFNSTACGQLSRRLALPVHRFPRFRWLERMGRAPSLPLQLPCGLASSGLTTSPHLVSWCERIRVHGTPIPAASFASGSSTSNRSARSTGSPPLNGNGRGRAGATVELMVLEVGLGGRLDATTAHLIAL